MLMEIGDCKEIQMAMQPLDDLLICTMDKDADKQGFPIHPLLIDHIVENILELMDPELLGHYCKIFRLVCKDWSRIATSSYKSKRGQITFKKNFVGRVSDLFVRVMKTSSDIPFEKFVFCTDSYDNEHFDEILHVCSGSITDLELNIINPCDLRFPKTFPNLILWRLKSLVFLVRIENLGYLQIEMASLLDALLDSSPNLESLDVMILGGMPRSLENAHHHTIITRKFGDVISRKLPLKIRHLKLKMTLTDEQLRCLTRQDLKIQNLDVYFQQSQFKKETMEEFLIALAPSVLQCKAIGNQFLMDINYPVFQNLKVLIAMGKPPPAIKYQKIFPSLEKIELCLWDDNPRNPGFTDNCYSESLTHVDFPYIVSNPDVYIKMARCFPNLKKLTNITVENMEAMRAIFKSLLTLEVLEITLGSQFHELVSVDTIFTGIPVEASGLVLRLKELQQDKVALKHWNHYGSIRNLTELKSLSITVSPFKVAYNVRLTDITVYYGFLHLKNLTKIHLDDFPISDVAMQKLQETVCVTRPC